MGKVGAKVRRFSIWRKKSEFTIMVIDFGKVTNFKFHPFNTRILRLASVDFSNSAIPSSSTPTFSLIGMTQKQKSIELLEYSTENGDNNWENSWTM